MSINEDEQLKHYPDIHVNLVGENGNAFAILGACREAMKEADCSPEEITQFYEEATGEPPEGISGYDHLLQTCLKYFNVD